MNQNIIFVCVGFFYDSSVLKSIMGFLIYAILYMQKATCDLPSVHLLCYALVRQRQQISVLRPLKGNFLIHCNGYI